MTVSSRDLADMAALAYSSHDDVRHVLELTGWKLERWIQTPAGTTTCLVATRGDDAVVAFRGTEPTKLRQWIIDIDARLERWSNGKFIHAGFKASAETVWPLLWLIVDELLKLGLSLHLTGHSKGAAEAVVTAACIRSLGGKVDTLETFGCPRVGNAAFATWLDSKLFPGSYRRWVHNNDIVTRAPFGGKLIKFLARWVPFLHLLPVGYRHGGKLHYIAAEGHIEIDPPMGALAYDRLKGRWLAGEHALTDGTRDHGMEHYRKATA